MNRLQIVPDLTFKMPTAMISEYLEIEYPGYFLSYEILICSAREQI
jgi:hypothetical protein